MGLYKVAVYGTVGKAIRVNPDATIGAQIGVDLLMPDGSIATIAEIAAAVAALAAASTGGSGSAIAHSTLAGLTFGDDHPQYTRRDILTTRGDMYTQGASAIVRLPVGTSHQFLSSDGTDPGWVTLFANPTASVGLAAVNGSAFTAMRSDAAPALDQGIVPTWTGQHTFNLTPLVGAVKVVLESRTLTAGSGLTGGGDLTANRTFAVDFSTVASATPTYLTVANETSALPNSRRVVAGTNISFDDTTPSIRTINVPAGLASPLTTKGDIWGYDTGQNRIPVGADGRVLTADSGNALGVSWQPAAAGQTDVRGGTWVASSGAVDASVAQDIPIYIPRNCTINKLVIMTHGGSGSCSVDLWRKAFGSYPPAIGDSLTNSHPAVISGGITYSDTSFTGWTSTSLLTDDVVFLHLNSASTFTMISVQLRLA